jgi:hypothetical protein
MVALRARHRDLVALEQEVTELLIILGLPRLRVFHHRMNLPGACCHTANAHSRYWMRSSRLTRRTLYAAWRPRPTMTKRKPACAVLLLCAIPWMANAQDQLPSDADLRTAYCIPVIQDDIGKVNEGLALYDQWIANIGAVPENQRAAQLEKLRSEQADVRTHLANIQSTLHRLQAFLIPRMPSLDVLGLLAASNRAKADIKQADAELNACTPRCLSTGAPDCHDTKMCVNADLLTRRNACLTPTWLPF